MAISPLLNCKEAADFLRVSPEHIRKLVRSGKIRAYGEGRRGGYRTNIAELEAYCKNMMKGQENV